MAGKNGKFKTITINDNVCKKLDLTSGKVNYELQKVWEEKQKIQKFASKITKAPKIVSVYTIPYVESGERGEDG